MITIAQSVGRGGRAKRGSDVLKIQKLLNKAGAKPELVPDSKVGTNTIRAIERFQSGFMKRPDGRIDPGGRSLRRLNGQGAEPKNTYERRMNAAKKRGDKYMFTPAPKTVAYHKDFNTFAARVAYEFRHDVIYRRDNGQFAIGLVKASGDLKAIHDILDLSEGEEVVLNATIFRRKDTRPGNRWVMSIRFPKTVSVDGDPEPVPPKKPDPHTYKAGFQAFLDRALLLAADMEGEPGKRIRKLLELADRLPFARATYLWYYDPWGARGQVAHCT